MSKVTNSKENKLITKDSSISNSLDTLEFAFEVKEMKEDKEFFVFEGLASTFGNIDLGDDVVEIGAFTKSIAEKMPIILWQHRTSEPIGMPIKIMEIPEGLFVQVRLPKEDSLVKGRVIPQMKVGSVRKMSIGFNIVDSEMDGRLRRLKEIDLQEISLVTFPMNPQADVTGFKAKTDAEGNKISDHKFNLEDVIGLQDKKQLREFFKSSGLFTKQAADYVLTTIFKSTQGEPDADEIQGEPENKKAVGDLLRSWTLDK
jgi:HK97 family phage prohead protease